MMRTVKFKPALASTLHTANRGFTLVEVMVALVIVATSISALLVQIMGNVDSTAYLRDKTFAQWVALNQLELLYLENKNTNKLLLSERNGSEEMVGREWYWTIKPLKRPSGSDENFQQVQITVRADEDDESTLVSMKAALDKYHRP